MNIETAKQINLADYLHSLGYSPVKQQGINLWYKSPLREETEASFKVNTERNQWYDFGLGKGGGIIELAAHLYATDKLTQFGCRFHSWPYFLTNKADLDNPIENMHKRFAISIARGM